MCPPLLHSDPGLAPWLRFCSQSSAMLRRASSLRPLWAGCCLLLAVARAPAQDVGASASAPAPTPVRLEERGFPAIRTYLPRDYGGHNQIWRIGETRSGLLYFGAHSEVLEFDGITWRKIPVPGAAWVRGLAVDEQDRIWVAGVNEFGEIRPGPDGQLVFASLREHLPADLDQLGEIRTVHAMPDGIYFQSDVALLRWDGTELRAWEMHEKYVSLAVPWQDRLIVCRMAAWAMPKADGGWDPVPWEPAPPGEILMSDLVPDGHGGWWAAATRHGVLHTDGVTAKLFDHEVGEFIRQSRLMAMARLPDGRLLFGSLGRGLLVTDENLNPILHLDESNGLPSETVLEIQVTHDGMVWLGTDNGVVRLDFSPGITRFGVASGLGRNGVESVARIDDEVVLATTNGPFVFRAGETPPANPVPHRWATVEDNLNVFYPMADGVMLGGLQRIWWVQPDSVEAIRSPSNIRQLLVHPRFPDYLFGLHLTGIAVWKRDGDTWRMDHSVDEPRGEFNGMAVDATGDLWIGSANDGFWRLHYSEVTAPTDAAAPLPDPTITHYDESRGIPTRRDRALVQTLDGAPLFMTGRGLFRHDPSTDTFRPETRYDPRFTDGTWVAFYTAPSPSGGLWIEARRNDESPVNVTYPIGKALNGTFTPLALPYLSEIGALNSLHCEMVDGEEILWVCGRNALLRVNITRTLQSPPPRVGATLLHRITTASGKVLHTHRDTTPLQVHPGDNSLRFHFGTPGLAGEPDRLHTSRLIGFVDGDEEITASGERTFTNLPPGTYTFEARGRTSDYRWSEPVQYQFEVLPPWWLTPWAQAGALFSAAAGIVLIVRWRTRRLVRQREALEAIVAARTAELANKAKALERLHQLEHDATLAARLAAETARLELLRYQLNPHFLFNSLNSIRALVHASPAAASEMVTKLAEFCRRTLNRGSDEMVSVDDEVEMARNYLEIEQVRWQDGLAVHLEIEPGASACELPQNLLLPLLENAIKYGGRTSESLLEVSLRITRAEEHLRCEVANTGRWVEPTANPFTDSTQIGLQNLRQRLHRHYGDRASVRHRTEHGQVIITVDLPCHFTPTSD